MKLHTKLPQTKQYHQQLASHKHSLTHRLLSRIWVAESDWSGKIQSNVTFVRLVTIHLTYLNIDTYTQLTTKIPVAQTCLACAPKQCFISAMYVYQITEV